MSNFAVWYLNLAIISEIAIGVMGLLVLLVMLGFKLYAHLKNR